MCSQSNGTENTGGATTSKTSFSYKYKLASHDHKSGKKQNKWKRNPAVSLLCWRTAAVASPPTCSWSSTAGSHSAGRPLWSPETSPPLCLCSASLAAAWTDVHQKKSKHELLNFWFLAQRLTIVKKASFVSILEADILNYERSRRNNMS